MSFRLTEQREGTEESPYYNIGLCKKEPTRTQPMHCVRRFLDSIPQNHGIALGMTIRPGGKMGGHHTFPRFDTLSCPPPEDSIGGMARLQKFLILEFLILN